MLRTSHTSRPAMRSNPSCAGPRRSRAFQWPTSGVTPQRATNAGSRASIRGARVKTTFVRFGSGFGRLRNVFRPMSTMPPVVSCLNHLKSSGRCHGICPPFPITRFSDMAAMAFIARLRVES